MNRTVVAPATMLRPRAAAPVLLAALVAATAACGRRGDRPGAGAPPPLPARTLVAEEVAWPSRLEVPATVLPLRRATPATVLMGRVDRVLRKEGDRVRAGEVLARVESREVTARLAQAEAAAEAARAMADNARLTKERIERLASHQAASRKNLDDATAGFEAATANLRAAEEGVKAAQVSVGYSEVTAPFAGVVVDKRVEAGDTAAPGMPLFVVEDLSRVKIEAAVPESALRGLTRGDPVEAEIESAGGTWRGTLAEILPAADPRSRTFTVRVVLDNPGGALRSGMFARLLIGGHAGKALAVPDASLVRQGPLTGLFVVDEDGTARLRFITPGRIGAGRVEILTGLSAGERIVLSPPAGLVDGGRVQSAEESAGARPGR